MIFSKPYSFPTRENCIDYAKNNPAFIHKIFMINGYRIDHFNYDLASYQDFISPNRLVGKNSPTDALELRGLCFIESPDGKIQRELMLRKFFGYEQTQSHFKKDLVNDPFIDISEKIDGTLIRPVQIGETIFAKTLNSFDGPHCIAAQTLFETDPYKNTNQRLLSAGYIPFYEFVSANFKIVLEYPQDKLILTQIRNSETGAYITPSALSNLIQDTPVSPRFNHFVLDTLIDQIKTEKNKEGYVAVTQSGKLVKFKTQWYEDFHDVAFEKNRSAKKCLNLCINKTIDDMIGSCSEEPFKTHLINLSENYNSYINSQKQAVQNFLENTKNLSKKDCIALCTKENKDFFLYAKHQFETSPETLLENIHDFLINTVKKYTKTEEKAKTFIQNTLHCSFF